MNRIESVTKPLKWSMALLLAALVAGCGDDPILGTGGAAAPGSLGILAPFGIASAGGITNVNSSITTKVNGDTVMAPNQFCNGDAVGNTDDFGPCTTTGDPLTNNPGDRVMTQIWPDTTSADAVMVALLAKWNSISPASMPGATVLGCGTIGDAGDAGALIGCAGNATIPPGVYISSTSSSIGIAGTLTLNGGPTDVWVFQAPSSTLVTASTSTIALTGGARASNVWWHVGSSATIGGGTTFNGNVLASASITMQTLATSCGRLLSGAEAAGAFVFESNIVSVPGHANAPVGCE
jgi:hypothetical protein